MTAQNTQTLETIIKQQMKVNQSKNLLYENAGQIMSLDPSFLAALETLLDSSLAEKSDIMPPTLSSYSAQALVKRLHAVNQYVRVDDRHIAELEAIYHNTWQVMLQTRDIHNTLREHHYPRLSQWLAALYPAEFIQKLRLTSQIGHVVNEEYTAEFQVELFGLQLSQIKSPLLDIGCGSHANLVCYLRNQGIEAYGFDRDLEVQASYLELKDWLDYALEASSWGTIISNMAFTNHLNYAYHHDPTQLEAYLLKLKEIYEALIEGGSFYCAPGLPWIEDHLAPENYQVDREQIDGEIYISCVTRLMKTS